MWPFPCDFRFFLNVYYAHMCFLWRRFFWFSVVCFCPHGNQRCGLVFCLQQSDAELSKETGHTKQREPQYSKPSRAPMASRGGLGQVRGFKMENSWHRQCCPAPKGPEGPGDIWDTEELSKRLFFEAEQNTVPSPHHPPWLHRTEYAKGGTWNLTD